MFAHNGSALPHSKINKMYTFLTPGLTSVCTVFYLCDPLSQQLSGILSHVLTASRMGSLERHNTFHKILYFLE